MSSTSTTDEQKQQQQSPQVSHSVDTDNLHQQQQSSNTSTTPANIQQHANIPVRILFHQNDQTDQNQGDNIAKDPLDKATSALERDVDESSDDDEFTSSTCSAATTPTLDAIEGHSDDEAIHFSPRTYVSGGADNSNDIDTDATTIPAIINANRQLIERQIEAIQASDSLRWNFDFRNGRPMQPFGGQNGQQRRYVYIEQQIRSMSANQNNQHQNQDQNHTGIINDHNNQLLNTNTANNNETMHRRDDTRSDSPTTTITEDHDEDEFNLDVADNLDQDGDQHHEAGGQRAEPSRGVQDSRVVHPTPPATPRNNSPSEQPASAPSNLN